CYFNAPPLSETYTLSLHDALPILGVAAKYVFYRNPQHELLLSAGVGWDVGGTGAKKVGAESFDTVTPQLFWGKCFGDLPDTVQFLKPLVFTGVFGVAIPTRKTTKTVTTSTAVDEDTGEVRQETEIEKEFNPVVAKWGFTLQYNLQYLQSFVRDVGLPKPFSRMVPIVEFAMQTPLEGKMSGR